MKKLLLTGFVPFLDHKINPTEEIVKQLDEKELGNYKVHGRILPVDFGQSAVELLKHYEEIQPDAVISLGLAAGRNRITPERIAINCNDGEPDNNGFNPTDQAIDEEGPDGLFSTLPIRRFVNVLNKNGYPAEISNTAGTYLCNNVMFNMLNRIRKEGKEVKSGFIHIPASHSLALTNNQLPSWSEQDLVDSIRLMIEELDG